MLTGRGWIGKSPSLESRVHGFASQCFYDPERELVSEKARVMAFLVQAQGAGTESWLPGADHDASRTGR